MEKFAQAGEGGWNARPPSFSLFTIMYKVSVYRSSWEGRYTHPIFHLYPMYSAVKYWVLLRLSCTLIVQCTQRKIGILLHMHSNPPSPQHSTSLYISISMIIWGSFSNFCPSPWSAIKLLFQWWVQNFILAKCCNQKVIRPYVLRM